MMKKINVWLLVLAAAFALGCTIIACQVDTAPRVTVTFDDPDGGNVVKAVTVEKGKSLGNKLPAGLVREGPYLFYGWFEGASQYFRDTPIGADITLTARWSDDVVTITFAFTQKDDDGKIIKPAAAIPSIPVIKGSSLGLLGFPTAPRAPGWAFEGWFQGDEEFTSTTVVTDNITLTARWAAKEEFTVNINPGPGGGEPSELKVYADECIDEWEARFPPKPEGNTVNAAAFFVAWFDDENREYSGRTPITRDVTITAKWGLPPYSIDFKRDVTLVESSPGDGYGDVDYAPVVREAWDSPGGANPKWVIVNNTTYDIPYNTNRWRILYRITLQLPDDFDVGFYTRYTIRARFYANTQGQKDFSEEGKFTPNTPADAVGYSEAGLLHGVNSQSDDGWGQISWCSVANWDGQGANADTMLQRYNLDRKGGTINDTWAPLRSKELKYPPYLLIQTSDAYIGHIEVYAIVFHNGEWEHTAYEGEEPPSTGEEEKN